MNADFNHFAWPDADAALTSSITAAIDGVSDENIRISPHAARELAGGVAAYLAVPSDRPRAHALALSARALAAIGESRLAHRLLLFSSGLLQPAAFTSLGAGPAWTMDLQRLRLGERDGMELLLFATLDLVLAACAEIWDSSRGHGELCLRHVSGTCATLLGRPRRHKAVIRLGNEIRSRCRYKLGLMQVSRRWETAPAVMDLDWWC